MLIKMIASSLALLTRKTFSMLRAKSLLWHIFVRLDLPSNIIEIFCPQKSWLRRYRQSKFSCRFDILLLANGINRSAVHSWYRLCTSTNFDQKQSSLWDFEPYIRIPRPRNSRKSQLWENQSVIEKKVFLVSFIGSLLHLEQKLARSMETELCASHQIIVDWKILNHCDLQ